MSFRTAGSRSSGDPTSLFAYSCVKRPRVISLGILTSIETSIIRGGLTIAHVAIAPNRPAAEIWRPWEATSGSTCLAQSDIVCSEMVWAESKTQIASKDFKRHDL